MKSLFFTSEGRMECKSEKWIKSGGLQSLYQLYFSSHRCLILIFKCVMAPYHFILLFSFWGLIFFFNSNVLLQLI